MNTSNDAGSHHHRPHYRTFIEDNARWDDFVFRPGDIVISTPPKCGTTWTQMLCALLIFQDPQQVQPLAQLSPWLDMLTLPKADVFTRLAAQQHRRFIKTHTPLDGLPIEEQVTYICVGRDPRDAAMSMFHHMANIQVEVVVEAIQKVTRADGLEAVPLPALPPPAEAEAFFWHWVDDNAPATHGHSSLLVALHHFTVALRAADRSNVVVLHYSDLAADLEKEMRRLAERLNIVVPEPTWPVLVQAASFESMRARAVVLTPNADQDFWKDAGQFFHSGTGGHWRAFFDEPAGQRYAARVAALVSPEVASWAHFGWRGTTT
jgi:aryl sulfotransferase